MSRGDREANPYKVYIGGLPSDATEDEIRRGFRKYGRIVEVQPRGRFAFVEYQHLRDAEDAMKDMDGIEFLGGRISVRPHGMGRNRDLGPPRNRVSGPPVDQIVPPPPKSQVPAPTGYDGRTDWRVIVEGLDERVSWQDLKDFGRNVADVNYANVFTRDGRKVGVIEYFTFRDMQAAIKELNGKKLYEREVEIEEDRGQYEVGRKGSGGGGGGSGGGGRDSGRFGGGSGGGGSGRSYRDRSRSRERDRDPRDDYNRDDYMREKDRYEERYYDDRDRDRERETRDVRNGDYDRYDERDRYDDRGDRRRGSYRDEERDLEREVDRDLGN
ncbi:unnamed protein product [Vitrella brassicaformis CCMP3155]|uniref:RRM domain-containing protein n=2 Tax=Vitrella brassicaformis TaxID=1169539 RepID=A0A0G4FUF2_VITBC|nr:unnamed protein product [Vitrella brassicaformis CCMP3155]|eukprot:CEM18363.1 unnamed protein product [Vitrella brassicaformis CCMP3155]